MIEHRLKETPKVLSVQREGGYNLLDTNGSRTLPVEHEDRCTYMEERDNLKLIGSGTFLSLLICKPVVNSGLRERNEAHCAKLENVPVPIRAVGRVLIVYVLERNVLSKVGKRSSKRMVTVVVRFLDLI